jgi:hypothetical protein
MTAAAAAAAAATFIVRNGIPYTLTLIKQAYEKS